MWNWVKITTITKLKQKFIYRSELVKDLQVKKKDHDSLDPISKSLTVFFNVNSVVISRPTVNRGVWQQLREKICKNKPEL